MLTSTIVTKLTLARYLFRLAEDQSRSHRDVAAFVAVNMMQDAVEVFLLAAAEHLNAPSDARAFETLLDRVDQKLSPMALPFRARLIQLNKARVNAKHHAIRPDEKELRRFVTMCREFFEESSRRIFRVEFWTVSLIELIPDTDETKEMLIHAREAFDAGEYEIVLIECRKAIFSKFEWQFDLKPFVDGGVNALFSIGSKVPAWVRDTKFLAERIKDPFDYIFFDDSEINKTMLELGVDTTVYWNIWRLTPAVYRDNRNAKWLVERSFTLLEEDGLQDRAAYVLDNTIDIMLKYAAKGASTLWTANTQSFYVDLKTTKVRLYSRADKGSPVSETTPDDVTRLFVTSTTPGLNDEGLFYRVAHDETGRTYFGYLHEEDVA